MQADYADFQPVFVDESIHDGPGFILAAVVCPRMPMDAAIDAALTRAGFRPGIDEFKSCARMSGKPTLHQLRSDLQNVLFQSESKIGVLVCDRSERHLLINYIVELLERMSLCERFAPLAPNVFVDQGIITKRNDLEIAARQLPVGSKIQVDQDACLVRGLQLADLCAHDLATVLLGDLGFKEKLVPAPSNSGFDGPLSLEFLLYHPLRWSLSSHEPKWFDDQGNHLDLDFAHVPPFGLRISANCQKVVREAAELRFGRILHGCFF